MTKKFCILTSNIFLFAIAVLLLNDFYLKYEFHNWITGKLSDFAGIFALGLVVTCFLKKKHQLFGLLLVGVLFIWWKSPISSSFIDSWNSLDAFKIGRVVDYTDLIALFTLFIIPTFTSNLSKFKKIKIKPVIILPIVAFSFVSTSSMKFFTDYKFEDEELRINFNYSKEDLRKMLLRLNGSRIDTDIIENFIIIPINKDTLSFSANSCNDFNSHTEFLKSNELMKGNFIINPISLNKSELVFFNTFTKYKHPGKDRKVKAGKKKIFKIVRKELKNKLKLLNKNVY